MFWILTQLIIGITINTKNKVYNSLAYDAAAVNRVTKKSWVPCEQVV